MCQLISQRRRLNNIRHLYQMVELCIQNLWWNDEEVFQYILTHDYIHKPNTNNEFETVKWLNDNNISVTEKVKTIILQSGDKEWLAKDCDLIEAKCRFVDYSIFFYPEEFYDRYAENIKLENSNFPEYATNRLNFLEFVENNIESSIKPFNFIYHADMMLAVKRNIENERRNLSNI